MKTVTIHSDNANVLFHNYQKDEKTGMVQEIKDGRPMGWMYPSEKLKLKLSNNIKLQNDETRKSV